MTNTMIPILYFCDNKQKSYDFFNIKFSAHFVYNQYEENMKPISLHVNTKSFIVCEILNQYVHIRYHWKAEEVGMKIISYILIYYSTIT